MISELLPYSLQPLLNLRLISPSCSGSHYKITWYRYFSACSNTGKLANFNLNISILWLYIITNCNSNCIISNLRIIRNIRLVWLSSHANVCYQRFLIRHQPWINPIRRHRTGYLGPFPPPENPTRLIIALWGCVTFWNQRKAEAKSAKSKLKPQFGRICRNFLCGLHRPDFRGWRVVTNGLISYVIRVAPMAASDYSVLADEAPMWPLFACNDRTEVRPFFLQLIKIQRGGLLLHSLIH